MGKHTKRNAAIAIVFIAMVSVGIYFGLAYPFPVQSTPISLTGILTQEDIPGIIIWPNSQIQVTIHLTSVTAIWGFEIRDAADNPIPGGTQVGIATSTTTVTTPWLDATGSYTIIITCIGDLEGTVTVVARGWPFITP
ncbi:MAG: hypothetical protein ACXADB_06840 [Candidatus Hermodarchaeia archaeon]|jgi:hypothetical protein